MDKRLYVIVPCYNEEEVLDETSKRLKEKMDELVGKEMVSSESRILLLIRW